MSYLSPLRLAFHGAFQADVSTVNNDVRHFDSAAFEESWQEPQDADNFNGWWNPDGSNAFRLSDCSVRQLGYGDGSLVERGDLVGSALADGADRVSAKLVDLDPQWQLASQIWGLTVRLLGTRGEALLSGRYQEAPFRDLVFGRAPRGGDGGASATFTSVLTDLQWADADPSKSSSRFLRELWRAVGRDGALSIRLMTYAYVGASSDDRFTYGRVAGVIGPANPRRPRSFVLGRRMVPQPQPLAGGKANFFDATLQTDAVLLDLSNALPLTRHSIPADLGPLELVALTDDSVQPGGTVDPAQQIEIGTVEGYADRDFLPGTAGIVPVTGKPAALAAAATRPLALLSRVGGPAVVLWRETSGGRHVRAEEFVQRLQPGETARATLWASRWGIPLPGAKLALKLLPPIPGLGGNGTDTPDVPIPVVNTPPSAVRYQGTATTGKDGHVVVSVETTPPGNPRGYIDGQLYLVGYNFADQPVAQSSLAPGLPLDVLALILFDQFDEPKAPTWEEVGPILKQYANLYPIMSRFLFDIGDEKAVSRNRQLMRFAFTRPISDPNYMPITRDLSEAKRRTIVRWLDSLQSAPPTPTEREARPGLERPRPPRRVAGERDDATDGKTAFAASLARGWETRAGASGADGSGAGHSEEEEG